MFETNSKLLEGNSYFIEKTNSCAATPVQIL